MHFLRLFIYHNAILYGIEFISLVFQRNTRLPAAAENSAASRRRMRAWLTPGTRFVDKPGRIQ
jgi:hypothetical protein